MSLLQNLPYQVYSDLLQRTDGWALRVAEIKNLRNVPEINAAKFVINALDRRGYSVGKFYKLLDECQVSWQSDITPLPILHYSNPSVKVAILIGNAVYNNWSNLVTPVSDCRVLGDILKSLGFIVVILENVNSIQLKESIENLCSVIPSNSYTLIYFAGHGFELCGAKYMLGIECPSEKYTVQNGVSENFITKNAFSSKPDLFILLLDMCRKPPDRRLNPEIYSNIPPLEEFLHNRNLIIGYATSPFMPSFEKLCCESTISQSQHDSCESRYSNTSSFDSKDIGNQRTHKLGAEDHLTGVSLYVRHLQRHLRKDDDFLTILEMVHKDFADEQCEQTSLQKPQKLDNVSSKFYLSCESKGDDASESKIFESIGRLNHRGITAHLL